MGKSAQAQPPLGYSDLEVDYVNNAGLEVVDHGGIEVDQLRTPQWAEGEHNAPPQSARPGSKEEKIGVAYVVEDGAQHEPPPKKTICGVAPRTFWIVFVVAALLVVGGAVGGGIGGWMATRSQTSVAPDTAGASNRTKSSPVFQNSTITAMHWKDGSNVTHHRVFFQAKDGTILESARDSGSPAWNVTAITDPGTDIKLGTTITAVGGYPHVNTSWELVRPCPMDSPPSYLADITRR
jgi:hypothetical protein